MQRSMKATGLGAAILGLAAGLGGLAAPASAQDKTIYDLMPNTALSGVIDPRMHGRKDIKKAWPKMPADPKTIHVGWTEITLNNPWFTDLIDTVKREAPKKGFDVDVEIANGSLETQCSQIDTFITKKDDVIVVDPTQILGVASCINRAVDAGIPVVAIGTVPSANARILTTITPNPYQNGFKVGRYVVKHMGDKPIVAAALIGVVGNSTSESRINGIVTGIVYQRMKNKDSNVSMQAAQMRGFKMFQTLKGSGHVDAADLKFNIVAMGVGNWTTQGGLSAAEDILTAHGDKVNIFLSDNDYMAAGALRAVRNIGKKGKIQAVAAGDGDREALDMIKAGKLLATATWSPEETAIATIDFLNEIFRKGRDASNLPLGSYFESHAITAENVASFIDSDKSNKFYKYTITPVKSIPEIRAEASKSSDASAGN